MTVSLLVYGPVSVVRNSLDTMAYASTRGPAGMPLLVSASASTTDGQIIGRMVRSAGDAWAAVGGMPPDLRAEMDELVTFDHSVLLPRQGEQDERRLYSVQATKGGT